MAKWIVQRYHTRLEDRKHNPNWVDIRHAHHSPYDPEGGTWEGENAGDAFHKAVIANPDERVQSTTYRVLPYDGGATFNLSFNVEAQEHMEVHAA